MIFPPLVAVRPGRNTNKATKAMLIAMRNNKPALAMMAFIATI
jgi:hypothetical protein